MKVTKKGQVTIPQAIRERLGLQPGTEVDCEVVGDAVRITKLAPSMRGGAVVERLRDGGHGPMSTDEILALTRE